MPLMRPEEMYRIGMGLGTAQMQGEMAGASLYGHMLQTEKLQEEINRTRALRELARSIPKSQTYTLSGQTMPQGMTGNEEYVPAETQTQTVEIPLSTGDILRKLGEGAALKGYPEAAKQFVAASEEFRKLDDPVEYMKGVGDIVQKLAPILGTKGTAAFIQKLQQGSEWKKKIGEVDAAMLIINNDGSKTVTNRDPETGDPISFTTQTPDGKFHITPYKGEKWTDWGYGQKKNTKTGEIINVPTKPEKDTSGEWDRRQERKEQVQFKKEQKDVLDDYTRDVQKLRGRYDASVRSGIKMTDEDWNSALQEIVDQYEPKFKKYNIQWGKPSSKAQQAAGGKDEFGFTPGQTTSKNGVTYKYLGNDKWQKQ
jgi:hypothetical protein